MKKKLIVITILLLAVAAAPLKAWNKDKETYEALKPLVEVYSLIQESYVDESKTDPKELMKGAIDGMVGKLDPFSQYLDPQAAKDMSDDTKAEFGGLGIEISVKDGQLIVVAPIEDTPAYRAGVKAGDKILFIDGETTDGLTVMDAVHKLRGMPGTKVTITIGRENTDKVKDYPIIRDVIKITTARYSIVGEDVGYIRINEFMGDAAGVLSKALNLFNDKKIRKLIIDLRDDPGGLLDQSVQCADFFLPKGSLIVYTEGRDKDKTQKFNAENGEKFKGKIVVLINKGSASASEILAGALQDHNRAVVVGSTSFGKGSVQTILPLSDKSALRLTTARYLTPNGRKIHGVGIKPDIELEEPVASSYTASLYEKNSFEDFAAYYLKKHPEGLKSKKEEAKPGAETTPTADKDKKEAEKSTDKSVKVSESDIKMLMHKTDDDKLVEDFRNWLKEKNEDIKVQELAADRDLIAGWIKTEIAKKEKGRDAARRIAVENDIQIKRSIDILNTLSKTDKN